MARDQGLLFEHLKITGEALARIEDYAGSPPVLDALEFMAKATRTLANGKRWPWSDSQEHLRAAHALGRQAWTELELVLNRLPPEFRWQRYDAPCINGDQSYSDVFWLGDHFCFACWAHANTNAAIQRQYWRSRDDEIFLAHVSYEALHTESLKEVARIRNVQREQIAQSPEQQRWHNELMDKIERRQRLERQQRG